MPTYWTAIRRQEWVHHCRTRLRAPRRDASSTRYQFSILPKMLNSNHNNMNELQVAATNALANAIFGGPDAFKQISLNFFKRLHDKISHNKHTRDYMDDIRVVVKGGTAYAILAHDLPFSDLDVAIFINPRIPDETFDALHEAVNVIVGQVLAGYKKMLDTMFHFTSYQNPQVDCLKDFAQQDVDAFKQAHIRAMAAAGLTSAFESVSLRNAASRNSFIICDHLLQQDKVVQVDVPHFNMAECIPLAYTPLHCSFNNTVRNQMQRFDLFRMRWNCVNSEDGSRVGADFIDVTVPIKGDVTLEHFWSSRANERLINSLAAGVCLPSIPDCVKDLELLMTIWDPNQQKQDKRTHRIKALLHAQIIT